MRCPECSNNQKRSQGMQCSRCHYAFVLDPKVAPYLSDRRFTRAVDRVSDGGTHAFTAHQLHGLLQRREMGWRAGLRRMFSNHKRLPLPPNEIVLAVQRWTEAGRALPGLVDRPSLDSPDPKWPEPDVYDYGAEAVLVVDQPLLVDLLVRDGVHARARTAIIDADGYPSRVTPRVVDLVGHRPDLPIFLLHATSTDGSALEASVRAHLSATTNPVIDLGLAPDAARVLPGLRWAKRLTSVPADVLSHKWLTAGIETAIAAAVPLAQLVGADDSPFDADFG